MGFIYLSVFEFKRTLLFWKKEDKKLLLCYSSHSHFLHATDNPLLRWWKSLPKVQVDEAECERVGTPKG